MMTLRWRSLLGCGNKRVIYIFCNNSDLYIRFGRMWQCSPLIAECVRLKIGDSLLTLTLITSEQPLYTQYLYATNRILITDLQYCVCIDYRLHPGVLLPLNFWSTAVYAIWEKWWGPITFPRFRAAFDGMWIISLGLGRYSSTSSPFFTQLLLLDFHDVAQAISNISTMCTRSVRTVMQLDTWMNLA